MSTDQTKDSNNTCPICGSSAKISELQSFFGEYIKCSNCGDFILEIENLSFKLKSCIYYYMTSIHNQESIIPHFNANGWEDGVIENRNTIEKESLLGLFPKTIKERIDYIILNIAHMLKYIGNTFKYSNDEKNLYPLFFIDDSYGESSLEKQYYEIIALLVDLQYLKTTFIVDNNSTATLTSKGWGRADYLMSNKVVKLPQCFIAMWFDPSMETAKKAIIEAVKTCNYIPIVIDMKEHNNQIVPEIFFEIKRSRFIIADLTGCRNGVYYEAGYAEALSKPVIMSCKDDDFDKRHFDVAQKNTIKWSDEENLKKSLISRIESTVGFNR